MLANTLPLFWYEYECGLVSERGMRAASHHNTQQFSFFFVLVLSRSLSRLRLLHFEAYHNGSPVALTCVVVVV